MNIGELLESFNSDSKLVLARFSNNEALLSRFIKKFPADPNFGKLGEAIEQKNHGDIEISAHTLKGVAANLGFDVLSAKSSVIVNAVREGKTENLEEQFAVLTEEYEKTIKGINSLD